MPDAVERRRKTQRRKYPKNWRLISQRVRFKRAAGRCEWCGKPHGQEVQVGAENCWAGPDGQWRNRDGKPIPGPMPWPSKIWWQYVIRHPGQVPQIRRSTAHLDHDPKNCADENLAALCQFCHAEYDARQRLWSGNVSRDLKRGQKVMFK